MTSFYVYAIQHTESGNRYVGHTYRLRYRWYQHRFHLNRGDHHSAYLQRAWAKYGEAAFTFIKLHSQIATLDEAVTLEQAEIDSGAIYNSNPSSRSALGAKRTEETLAKLSAWQKGKPKNAEHRKKISETLTGRARLAESIRKHKEKMVGRTVTWGGKISETHRKNNKPNIYDAFGRSQHLRDWAREFNINIGTLSNRVKRAGMTMEQALSAPVDRTLSNAITKGVKKLSAFGQEKYLHEWAKEFGVRYQPLVVRIHRDGLSLEEALTRPLVRRDRKGWPEVLKEANRERSTQAENLEQQDPARTDAVRVRDTSL